MGPREHRWELVALVASVLAHLGFVTWVTGRPVPAPTHEVTAEFIFVEPPKPPTPEPEAPAPPAPPAPEPKPVPVTVQPAEAGGLCACVTSAGGRLLLPLPAGVSAQAATTSGRALMLGVRPEAVRFGDQQGVPVTVQLVEPTGPDTLVMFELGGSKCLGRHAPANAPRPGDTVRISLDPAALVYFDVESGERVSGGVGQ